ncbi:MAG: FprA family A-type flavoprotein [Eubacteriaceae bacterium]|nr:FprA family A-type flavoprotein [Eubacteriaceae bacterium]
MNITNDISYVGVHDRDIDLFESQYRVPGGISYNSYVITDDRCAVVDSVDRRFGEDWLANVRKALNGRKPDYLIVQHMEPDHSANVIAFADEYPDSVLVGTAKTFTMISNFFGRDVTGRSLVVKDGDSLSLGKHELKFVTAPMVHWPEVMLTYDSTDRVLFSADAFGRFGDPDRNVPWKDEARRYYIGIVGKYGAQVQTVLKKASALDIEKICPLHGPVLDEDLGYYIGLYDTWSSYRPEDEGVCIAYTSVYGHTAEAAKLLAQMLEKSGVRTAVYDLARSDMSLAVAEAFRYDRLVLATTTYNGDILPFMREFIEHLTERNFRARKVGLIENGSWGPQGVKVMKALLEGAKDLEFCAAEVKILSALSDESRAALEALAEELR